MAQSILIPQSDVNFRHPLMRGIVSRWKVVPNFVGGNRFVDLCGRNHGTLINGTTWSSAAGRINGNGSLSFDGVDDSIYVGTGDFGTDNGVFAFDGTQSFSVACWIMPLAAGSFHRLITRGDGSFAQNRGWYLAYDTTNKYQFLRGDIAAGNDWLHNVGFPVIGIWDHIIATYDSATLKLYINGNKYTGSLASTRTIGTGAAPLRIAKPESGTVTANVKLDDILIWNRALSSAEAFNFYQTVIKQYDSTLNYSPFVQFGRGLITPTASWINSIPNLGYFNNTLLGTPYP